MLNYIFRRLMAGIPLLVFVTLVTFLLLQLTPGDPAVMMLGQEATPEAVAQIRDELGLDRPLPLQYASFLMGIARGDLGRSYDTNRPVRQELGRALPATAQLAITGMVISLLVGIPLGVLTAVFHNSWMDQIVRVLVLLMVSIPTFWLGLLLIFLFSVHLGILPAFGRDRGLISLLLPSITLATFSLAIIIRMTRSALLDVINSDYIRTARAKGLSEGSVVLKHALRNALIPVTTVVGLQFGVMLTGAVVTETVFAWPGLGRMLVTAVFARDFPIIQGGVLLIAVVFILVNLVVDVLYAILDPRIRYS